MKIGNAGNGKQNINGKWHKTAQDLNTEQQQYYEHMGTSDSIGRQLGDETEQFTESWHKLSDYDERVLAIDDYPKPMDDGSHRPMMPELQQRLVDLGFLSLNNGMLDLTQWGHHAVKLIESGMGNMGGEGRGIPANRQERMQAQNPQPDPNQGIN